MEPKTKIISAVFLVSLLTTIILISVSLRSLSVNEIGLDYSSISKTVAKQVYGPGIHFLGVGHSFVAYPSTYMTLDFSKDGQFRSIKSRTKDGLEVAVEISFQYTFNKDQLRQLYFTHFTEYQKVFKDQAINVLADVTTKYDSEEFFTKRQEIGNNMKDSLNTHFTNNLFSTVHFFQLRSVDLPDAFEEAIMTTEVKKQDIEKAEAEKNTTIVELETSLQSAQYDKNVTLNLADGKAESIKKNYAANAYAYTTVQSQICTSYKVLKTNTSMTNEGFLQYVKAKVQNTFQGSNVLLGLSKIDA